MNSSKKVLKITGLALVQNRLSKNLGADSAPPPQKKEEESTGAIVDAGSQGCLKPRLEATGEGLGPVGAAALGCRSCCGARHAAPLLLRRAKTRVLKTDTRVSKRAFKNTSVNTFISATDPPLFLGVDTCRAPGEGQFCVGFRSVFGRFESFLTETDQKLTKNRPKVDPLQGVRLECAVYEG